MADITNVSQWGGFTVATDTLDGNSTDPGVATPALMDNWLSSILSQVGDLFDGSVTLSSAQKAQFAANVLQSSDVGMTGFFAMSSAPTGWLKANGAAVSRTTYAALFAAIGTTFGTGDGSTTFNLPDLRGYFLRSYDDGAGVDSGRVFGSAQTDANKSHTHTFTTDSDGAHTHDLTLPRRGGNNNATTPSASYVSDDPGPGSATGTTTSNGAHTHSGTTNADGGTETRPKNIALLACIKF